MKGESMKRRDLFRLIPFTIPAFSVVSNPGAAQEMKPRREYSPGEPFGMVYNRRIREMLAWVRETQSDKMLEAAYAVARTVEKGKKCWCNWDLGHTNSSDIFPNRIGQPDILTPGYDPKQVKDGDLVFTSFPGPVENIEDMSKKDLFIIGATCPWSGDVKDAGENIIPEIQKVQNRKYADIWIETNTDSLGAQVKVPGSPAPLGPESGPLYGSIFWMMIADACRILSRDGKPAAVKGDEPKLSDKTPRAGLNEPLMGDYYDTVMRQFEMIGMEMGDIRKMAKMAVDTILSGGNIYFYSRYPESLAYEATGRRGGLTCSRAIFDGHIEGTAKDCVIMGTYQPDDEADLKNLEKIKSMGMKTASIGPVTRDAKIPEGRIIARETEVHVGRVMDTYGLFALPGFDRKICPTSGVMNTAILWTVTGEIVDQIMERTGGNVPGIGMNGALRGSNTIFNPQVRAMTQSRGY